MDYNSFLDVNNTRKLYYKSHNLKPYHIDRVSKDCVLVSHDGKIANFSFNEFRVYLIKNDYWYFSNPSALVNFDFDIVQDVILYHGSIGGLRGSINVKHSSNLCDFGSGFYLGEDKMQASNRICNDKNGILYTYKMIMKDQRVYNFTDDLLWTLYIARNRKKFDFSKYKSLLKKFEYIDGFDVVVGLIADDKISEVYESFLDGNINSVVLAESLKLVNYGRQFVIKNQKYVSSKYLKLIEKHNLDKEDRKVALDWGKSVKFNMNTGLENLKIRYRRAENGYYIDEIIDKLERGV